MNEREIFIAAFQTKDAAERQAYLTLACGGDAELRQRVEALLRVIGEAGSFLEASALESETATIAHVHEAPGAVVGPYKLLQQIGEGGFGVVFMAEQQEPVRRKVALKVIKHGMDTRQVIARFEAERQALALMDHPNIAKVFDAGATASGRPYFVMELVKGQAITRYCDEQHLTPRQRLELFVPVCQAVQHAHQKGIIHRDLKPSNVMVSMYDGKPVPKVIDFGVAKAAGPKLTERTLFTELGTVVGTLEYMSPEQAELNQLDIDTRSDIYSLGVLLYELLTGTTPLERRRFKEVAFLEVLRLIREEESPRPSTRLSSTEALPSIAANRGLEPKKLSGLVRGELDWIVMKCLEKDRSRRYETANGLTMDVQRYLADEPVAACPPSVGYRLRKLLRRHRTALTTTALVALTMVAGTGVSVLQAVRATQAEATAVDERTTANANFRLALAAVDRYFTQVSDSPELKAHGLEELRRDLLRTAKEFYAKFVSERQHDPGLKRELGRAHLRLGDHAALLGDNAEAIQLQHQALAILEDLQREQPDDVALSRDRASSHFCLGRVYTDTRDWPKAEAAFQQALALLEPLADKQPADERLLQDLAESRHGLANFYVRSGRGDLAQAGYKKAIAVAERLLAVQPGKAHYQQMTATSHMNLGLVFANGKKYPEAEECYDKALPIFERLVREHPLDSSYQGLLASEHNGLAILYWNTSRPQKAEAAYKAAIAIQERLAHAHPRIPQYQRDQALQYSYLGALYDSTQRRPEAEVEYKKAAAIWERLVRDYPDTLKHQRDLGGMYGNLGSVKLDQGQHEMALAWYAKAINVLEAALKLDAGEPTAKLFLFNSYHGQAQSLTQLSRDPEALRSWARAVELVDSKQRAEIRLQHTFALVRVARFDEAVVEANELADKDATRATLYGAACILSLCSAGAQEQRELHAARAVELLRRAIARGPISANHLKNEVDFQALRARADFQELLKVLDKK